ncbi:MAG: hypothetical protein Q8N84_02290 [bacterium]|nr:hypothetical protein [bacterium]
MFLVLFALLLLSWTLIMSVPQFSSFKADFKISTSAPLAIAQTIVSITFLVSMVGGVLLAALAAPLALLEIPIEVLLRKKVYKLVKERQKIALDELVKETGVLENDLGFLLKNWTFAPTEDAYKAYKETKTIKRGHMQIDLNSKELSWQE